THGAFGPLFLLSFVVLVAYYLSKQLDILVSIFLSLTINILTLLLLIWLGALEQNVVFVYIVLLSAVGIVAWVR
ncbi:MAG: hypothetical protein QXL14_02195, partial [Candidatus Aenigmatarchaeota archaeon]